MCPNQIFHLISLKSIITTKKSFEFKQVRNHDEKKKKLFNLKLQYANKFDFKYLLFNSH